MRHGRNKEDIIKYYMFFGRKVRAITAHWTNFCVLFWNTARMARTKNPLGVQCRVGVCLIAGQKSNFLTRGFEEQFRGPDAAVKRNCALVSVSLIKFTGFPLLSFKCPGDTWTPLGFSPVLYNAWHNSYCMWERVTFFSPVDMQITWNEFYEVCVDSAVGSPKI